MKVIGFTNTYYTLWEVSEPYKEYISKYEYYLKQDFTYIKNLSKQLELAKSKISGTYSIDLSLRGSSSFTKMSEKINCMPDNVFKFGKYVGEDIDTISDKEYTLWYFKETKSETAKSFLLKNGYVYHDEMIMSKEERDNYIDFEKRDAFVKSLKKGLHFENGSREDLSLKEINSFSFEGNYGTTFVCEYATQCGKIVKYLGSSPPDISTEEYQSVKCTIKHSNYNGVDETKINRIKVN